MLLEPVEHIPDFSSTAQFRCGITKEMVLQDQQVGQLLLAQFLHPLRNEVVQNEG